MRIFFRKRLWIAIVMGGSFVLCVFGLQRIRGTLVQRSTYQPKNHHSGRFLHSEAA
jgi:hypothetical protein